MNTTLRSTLFVVLVMVMAFLAACQGNTPEVTEPAPVTAEETAAPEVAETPEVTETALPTEEPLSVHDLKPEDLVLIPVAIADLDPRLPIVFDRWADRLTLDNIWVTPHRDALKAALENDTFHTLDERTAQAFIDLRLEFEALDYRDGYANEETHARWSAYYMPSDEESIKQGVAWRAEQVTKGIAGWELVYDAPHSDWLVLVVLEGEDPLVQVSYLRSGEKYIEYGLDGSVVDEFYDGRSAIIVVSYRYHDGRWLIASQTITSLNNLK